MSRIKLTAKRQATFPLLLCQEMGVEAGDYVLAEPAELDGERVWVLKPVSRRWEWLRGAKAYAEAKDHDPQAIDRSIAAAWGKR